MKKIQLFLILGLVLIGLISKAQIINCNPDPNGPVWASGGVRAPDFWEQLPFPDTLDISCIAVNDQGHIFAGTVTGGSCVSNGIYRSTDNGLSWQHLLNTGTFAILSIDHCTNGVIYAGSNGSPDSQKYLYKTMNNGDTWDVISLPYTYNIPFIKCKGVDTVFLSLWSGGALLLRSFDGGDHFIECFGPTQHTGEYISDIAIAPDGTIYLSLMCFFPDQGGVYKSTDNGTTWHEIGMLNHQVQAVEINKHGDVFIGVFYDFLQGAGGLYALHHDSSTIDTCLYGPQVNGIAINSAGDIYAGIGWPDGVIVSKDNGLTFEFENSGLIGGAMGKIIVDNQNYLYASSDVSSQYLFKSVKPTVTALPDFYSYSGIKNILIYPNPAKDILNGVLLNNSTIQGIQNCRIYSSDGKLLANKRIEVTSNCFNVNIAGLMPGAYIVIIGNNRNYYKASFVKQ